VDPLKTGAEMKKWIFLSPHLDDAVYSCGWLIHQQVKIGHPVEIWTIFSGYPELTTLSPFARLLHERWGHGNESTPARRAEDQAACALLGAKLVHYDFLDVIYRTHPVTGQPEITERDDLFRDFHISDISLQKEISACLWNALAAQPSFTLCAPLGLGNHIDHQLVRKAAEALELPTVLAYYADFPYVMDTKIQVPMNNPQVFPIQSKDIEAWGKAIILYVSQVSSFWADEGQMWEELNRYGLNGGGSRLWFQDQ